jgi:hypothetical protein
VGTFFGNILNFPTHFLIRISPGNTVNGLNTSQAGDISVKLAGKILNVLGIFWVGIGQVLCPFPCNVFVMYWVRTPPLAPSGWPSRFVASVDYETDKKIQDTIASEFEDHTILCIARKFPVSHPESENETL